MTRGAFCRTFIRLRSRRCRINIPAQIEKKSLWTAAARGCAEELCGRHSVLLAFSALFFFSLIFSGCRQDMHNQPKFIPLRSSEFFADRRSARDPIGGTVARGQLHEDTYLYTGKRGTAYGNELPFTPANMHVFLTRGQERYNIYCSPCHDRVGNGNGMIAQRGFRYPPSLHQDRLRNAPLGHFFDVMSNGFGAMPDYASQVNVEDRWAIAAYIRALQLSQNAIAADVDSANQNKVNTTLPKIFIPSNSKSDLEVPRSQPNERGVKP